MKNTILVLSLVFALIMPSTAFSEEFEIAVGAWFPAPQGDLAYQTFLVPDTLDLENDLNYESGFNLNGRFRMELSIPFVPNFYFMATSLSYEERGVRQNDFNFGSYTFEGNRSFTSQMDLNHYDLALYWELPVVKKATLDTVSIDLGLNFRLYDFEKKIWQQPLESDKKRVEQGENFLMPLPMLYVAVQLGPVNIFTINTEARAIQFQDTLVYSLTARLKATLVETAFLSAGYRYDQVKFDKKGIDADMQFSGPVFEAGIDF